jgi:hypothetical protein
MNPRFEVADEQNNILRNDARRDASKHEALS